MTLLKLLDHCHKHNIKATVEYEAETDSIRLIFDHKETECRHTQLVPMLDIRHCSNPELILESCVDESVAFLTGDAVEVPEVPKDPMLCMHKYLMDMERKNKR